ncbi:6452_t:CDS:2 [Scutellospora calospora]|uniref:6452_t:CDS:1 n=1 Tax=Scutellospora calospora TaxID=85575 RepID=A0ACA9JTY8_9GLOM|nr:6452_t:CDS:2 [Scutellospora calospora]
MSRLKRKLEDLKKIDNIIKNNISLEDVLMNSDIMPSKWVNTTRKRKEIEKKRRKIEKKRRDEKIDIVEKLFGDELYYKQNKKRNGSTWWNGYERQDVVLLDDFNKKVGWDSIVNILNHTENKVEMRYGGFEYFIAKYVFMTSTKPPEKAYNFNGDKQKFLNMEWDIKYNNGSCDNEEIIEKGKMFTKNFDGKHFVKNGKAYWRREFLEDKKEYLQNYFNKFN